jgi:putative membrane protein
MSHIHHVTFDPFWAPAALTLVFLLYLRGWLRIRRLNLESVAGWRAGSFVLGLLLLWVAMASRLAALDHEMLTAHMVQHLLLMTFAPPLILLGAPAKPLLHALPQRSVQVIGRPFQSARIQQLGRVLAHPAVCWLGAAGTLVAWHVPAVFMLGLRSEMWHGIEQASFLVTGLSFWWPVVKPWRSASKWPESLLLVYLFLATLPCDILSGFLVFCERVVYPVYFSTSQPFGLSALEDQQCAGALMWTCVTVVYLIAAAIVTSRLLSSHGSQEGAIRQSETQAIALPRCDGQRMEAF